MTLIVLLLGLAVGVLVGLLGIGGGVVLVPALVYLLHMDQHLAQGTSLFILLPPVGLGALREYWKQGQVDLRAGILCALGNARGWVPWWLDCRSACFAPSQGTVRLFSDPGCGIALAKAAAAKSTYRSPRARSQSVVDGPLRDAGIFAAACICGVASGLFGIGGGTLLVPFLALFFAFGQHRAQGTSLIALIPPTGALAFFAYAKADYVSWQARAAPDPGSFCRRHSWRVAG